MSAAGAAIRYAHRARPGAPSVRPVRPYRYIRYVGNGAILDLSDLQFYLDRAFRTESKEARQHRKS